MQNFPLFYDTSILDFYSALKHIRHPADMQVIIGTMTPKHIADSAAGADVVLTRQEWYDLYFAAGNDLP